MRIFPLMRFIEDAAGTRWTVLFAGPFARRMLRGLQRHVVFRHGEQQLVAEHDWVNRPLDDEDLQVLLERLGASDA